MALVRIQTLPPMATGVGSVDHSGNADGVNDCGVWKWKVRSALVQVRSWMNDSRDRTCVYPTIVADPPWPYGKFNSFSTSNGPTKGRLSTGGPQAIPYPTMTIEQICALDVPAAPDAHLYLWTTSRFLPDAFSVAKAWGFSYSKTLVWAKNPMGRGMGYAYHPATEFVLFCHRGNLPLLGRSDRDWWTWKRPYRPDGKADHSRKPDAFLDVVETVSPGPYLELFARRNRLGWDTWGNEALNHVEVAS